MTRRKHISFRKYKKELNRKHSPANARLYQSFRKEEQRIVRARRKKAAKANPAKTRKGKTGHWMKAKAVKVVRKNGRLTVMVKR
jgi:hypothetical protein